LRGAYEGFDFFAPQSRLNIWLLALGGKGNIQMALGYLGLDRRPGTILNTRAMRGQNRVFVASSFQTFPRAARCSNARSCFCGNFGERANGEAVEPLREADETVCETPDAAIGI
jgi:hypothetical protein